ncbi:MAG: tail fiber protein [Desulfobacterales bacterium]|nr:tail fiber protein [Desulfobacterales bacterium]
MLLVGEDTFVGRKAGGNIESLTPNNTLEIIDKATNKSFIAAQSGIVLPWPTSNVPEGFLSCNGASVSRTTYADLFAVIGTEYGSVDIDSFSLPDYRGEFLRGWANGSNTDPDRDSRDKSGIIGDNVGSKQSSAMWGHKHNTFIDNSQTIGSPFTGLVGTGNGAGQDHPSFGPIEDNNGAPNISSESRPTNISVQFIIKT